MMKKKVTVSTKYGSREVCFNIADCKVYLGSFQQKVQIKIRAECPELL